MSQWNPLFCSSNTYGEKQKRKKLHFNNHQNKPWRLLTWKALPSNPRVPRGLQLCCGEAAVSHSLQFYLGSTHLKVFCKLLSAPEPQNSAFPDCWRITLHRCLHIYSWDAVFHAPRTHTNSKTEARGVLGLQAFPITGIVFGRHYLKQNY